MKKIVVTGATGFLGGYVVSHLAKSGTFEIFALGRKTNKIQDFNQLGVQFIQADLTYPEKNWLDVISTADIVIHCAALSSSWGKKEDFYNANVVGTQNLIRHCKNVTKFIHISTPSIYTESTDKILVKEDSRLPEQFINDYAWSKRLAEIEVESWANQQKVPTYILRPQAIIGIGDQAIVPRILRILEKEKLPIIGSGHTLTDVTCVENVAHSIQLCLDNNPKSLVNFYNITNDEPVNIYNLIEKLALSLDYKFKKVHLPYTPMKLIASSLEFIYKLFKIKQEPLLTNYSVNLLSFSRTLSMDKAKQELNYNPIMTTEQGVRNYVEHFKKERLK